MNRTTVSGVQINTGFSGVASGIVEIIATIRKYRFAKR